VIDTDSSAATATALLATLREATGDPALSFDQMPVPLTGGYYAEILRFRLTCPPAGLDGDLVARIVPDPEMGLRESTVQRHVASAGFATPAVRLTVPATSPLGRSLVVMDLVDGEPPMKGLDVDLGRTLRQIPVLVRDLPDHLAGVAASLHTLDPEPLEAQLERIGGALPTTAAAFVQHQVDEALAAGRTDLADAGERLLATQPTGHRRVIAHGDLHPFNLLMTPTGPVLVDWSVSLVADPAFTVAFTELMLANPPIALPRAGTAALGLLGRRMARRFLATYRARAGEAGTIDGDQLDWNRRVHALRILVELAGWDVAGTRPLRGHPWLVIDPVARRILDLRG
jgi:aminoglycoside phosphotransferase (APT) family kinase protein